MTQQNNSEPWDVSWFICRADAADVEYEAGRKLRKGETRRNLKVGDELWRVAQSIGPISADHCHWAGWHLGASEEDVRLTAAAPVMLAALYKAQVALCDAYNPRDRAALAAINEAIALATGEEPKA